MSMSSRRLRARLCSSGKANVTLADRCSVNSMIGPSNHYEADVLLSIIFSSIPANMFVVSHSVDKSEQRHCRIVVHMSFETTIDM